MLSSYLPPCWVVLGNLPYLTFLVEMQRSGLGATEMHFATAHKILRYTARLTWLQDLTKTALMF